MAFRFHSAWICAAIPVCCVYVAVAALLLPHALASSTDAFPTPYALTKPASNITIECFVSATATIFMTRAAAYYQILRPDLHIDIRTIDNTPSKSGSQVLFDTIIEGTADFGFSTLIPNKEQIAIAPDLMHFPAAAFPYGAAYSLPTLLLPLILDMKTLARIHSANITRWNDPAILALNPKARLPNAGIEVVLISESSNYVSAATNAFSNADDDFRIRIGRSSLPTWPLGQYHKYFETADLDGIGAYIRQTPYTIGLSLLFQATQLGATIAHMSKPGGSTVAPTFLSVHAGLNDQAVETKLNPADGTIITEQVDNVGDAPNPNSWPMLIQGTFSFAREYSRASCQERTELVKFLLFILDSETVQNRIAQELFVAVTSRELDSSIGLRAALQTQMRCQDLPINVGQTLSATTTSGYASLGSSNTDVRQLLLSTFAATDPSTQYGMNLMDEKDQLTILEQRRRNSSIDIGWIFPMAFRKMYGSTMQDTIAADVISFFPTSVSGIMPTYSLDPAVLSYMQRMNALPLKIDMEALAQVFLGDIDSWLHPMILSFNPTLAAAFANASTVSPRMNRVLFGSGQWSDAPISALSNHFIIALNHTKAFQNSEFSWNLPADWTNLTAKLDGIGASYYMATSEAAMASQIATRFGSVGYALIVRNTTDPTTDFDIVRYVDTNAGLRPVVVQGVPANFKHCLDAAPVIDDSALSNLDVELETVYDQLDDIGATCFPLLILTSLVLPNDVDVSALSHLSASTSIETIQNIKTSMCFHRFKAVHFMQFLALDEDANRAARMLGQEGFIFSKKWSDSLDAELLNLKCLGKYMLQTPALPWHLSDGVTNFVRVVAVFGIVGVIFAVALVRRHRKRTIILSSDLLLQACGLVGLTMLLLSTLMFIAPATHDICSGLSWTLTLGLTLVLAPQMLKLLKVRLFLASRKSKKLRKTELSRHHMYLAMAAFLIIDIIILLASQMTSTANGLLTPISTIADKGADSYEFVTCAPSMNAMPYAVSLISIKAITLFAGAIFGFRVRHVASAFGESTKISWSLWSATVSGVIIFPLIALSGGAYDDVYVFLVCFFILWMSLGSLALLFGYKVYAILLEEWHEYQQQNKSMRSARSSGWSSAGSTGISTGTGTGTGAGTGTGTGTTGASANRSTGTGMNSSNTGSNRSSDICELRDITALQLSLNQLQRYIHALERQLEKAQIVRTKRIQLKTHTTSQTSGIDSSKPSPSESFVIPISAVKYALNSTSSQNNNNNNKPIVISQPAYIANPSSRVPLNAADRKRLQTRQAPPATIAAAAAANAAGVSPRSRSMISHGLRPASQNAIEFSLAELQNTPFSRVTTPIPMSSSPAPSELISGETMPGVLGLKAPPRLLRSVSNPNIVNVNEVAEGLKNICDINRPSESKESLPRTVHQRAMSGSSVQSRSPGGRARMLPMGISITEGKYESEFQLLPAAAISPTDTSTQLLNDTSVSSVNKAPGKAE